MALDREHGRKLLQGSYDKRAVYFSDSDCVEYVSEDSFAIYERIDDFLTLIHDETKFDLIGFKLKGFKCIFETSLKPIFKLNDEQFVELVSVIEAVCTKIGDELFASDQRARAYKAAHKFALKENVKLTADFFPIGAQHSTIPFSRTAINSLLS
jgi:hypothetical protein